MADITRKEWVERTSEERVSVADAVLEMINKAVRFDYQLSYTNSFIGVRSGDKPANFFVVYPKKKTSTLCIRIKQTTETDDLLRRLALENKYADGWYWITLDSTEHLQELLPVLTQAEKELVEWKGEDYLTPKQRQAKPEETKNEGKNLGLPGFDIGHFMANVAPKSQVDEQKKLKNLATLIILTDVAGDGRSTAKEISAAFKRAVVLGYNEQELNKTANDVYATFAESGEELDLEALVRGAVKELTEEEVLKYLDICAEILLVDKENFRAALYVLSIFGDEAGVSMDQISQLVADKIVKSKSATENPQEANDDGNEEEDPEDVMNDDEWEDVPNPNEIVVNGDVATIAEGTVSLYNVDFDEAVECAKLIIPEGVKCIARGEIELENLKTIVFPKSLKVIEEDALDDCPNLDKETRDAIKHIQENQIIRKDTSFIYVDPTDEFADYDLVLNDFLDRKGYFESGEYVEEFDTDNLESDCLRLIEKYENDELFDQEEVEGINLGCPGLYIENAEEQLYTLVWRGEKIVSYTK